MRTLLWPGMALPEVIKPSQDPDRYRTDIPATTNDHFDIDCGSHDDTINTSDQWPVILFAAETVKYCKCFTYE